jgi:hypothetical protein
MQSSNVNTLGKAFAFSNSLLTGFRTYLELVFSYEIARWAGFLALSWFIIEVIACSMLLPAVPAIPFERINDWVFTVRWMFDLAIRFYWDTLSSWVLR